jgi:CubicO group peptidase (beta-lactamase class C family)
MGNTTRIQKRLDDKAEAIRIQYKLPNIAAVIVRDNGSTVMHTVKGVKDSSKSSTAASNKAGKTNFFNVGSISKPITGLFLACLVKKGVLSWDTKIKDVFPEFNSKAFRDRCGMNTNFLETKMHELVAHNSGMNGKFYYDEGNAWSAKPFFGDGDPFRYIHDQGITVGGNSRDEEWKNYDAMMYLRYLYAVLCMKKRKYKLGSTKNDGYDNVARSGYGSTITIATAMAERKLGRAWELIMTELLFDPLPMGVIFGNLPDGMQLHHFDQSSGTYKPTPWLNNDLTPYNAKFMTGAMHCTVDGMAQYIKYNLRALNYAQAFDVAQYQAPVTDAAKGGLFLGGGAQHEPLNHFGATGSSLAGLYIYQHTGYGIAVMMNGGGGDRAIDNSWKAIDEMMQELQSIHSNWATI